MSHSSITTKNKQQKHPKVYFQQYLFNSGEPQYDTSTDLPSELEAELVENSYVMRRHFRHLASRLRDRS